MDQLAQVFSSTAQGAPGAAQAISGQELLLRALGAIANPQRAINVPDTAVGRISGLLSRGVGGIAGAKAEDLQRLRLDPFTRKLAIGQSALEGIQALRVPQDPQRRAVLSGLEGLDDRGARLAAELKAKVPFTEVAPRTRREAIQAAAPPLLGKIAAARAAGFTPLKTSGIPEAPTAQQEAQTALARGRLKKLGEPKDVPEFLELITAESSLAKLVEETTDPAEKANLQRSLNFLRRKLGGKEKELTRLQEGQLRKLERQEDIDVEIDARVGELTTSDLTPKDRTRIEREVALLRGKKLPAAGTGGLFGTRAPTLGNLDAIIALSESGVPLEGFAADTIAKLKIKVKEARVRTALNPKGRILQALTALQRGNPSEDDKATIRSIPAFLESIGAITGAEAFGRVTGRAEALGEEDVLANEAEFARVREEAAEKGRGEERMRIRGTPEFIATEEMVAAAIAKAAAGAKREVKLESELTELAQAGATMQSVFDLADRVIRTRSGLMAKVRGGVIVPAKQLLGLGRIEQTYSDTRQAFLEVVARTIGGAKGVMTEGDIKRFVDGTPKLTDTVAIKDFKKQNIANIWEIAIEAKRRLLRGEVPDVNALRAEVSRRIAPLLDAIEGIRTPQTQAPSGPPILGGQESSSEMTIRNKKTGERAIGPSSSSIPEGWERVQ